MAMTFNIDVAGARDKVLIKMHADGKQVGWAEMDAADLDGFITTLARARTDLADEVPRTLEPNSQPQAVFDPIWLIGIADTGEEVLDLRHPGTGWSRYVFPAGWAEKLVGFLSA